MPNIKSAIKRVRVSEMKTRVARNKKTELRTVLKKTETAMATSASNCNDMIKTAQKKLDQAVSHGLMSKNTAARKKSQLMKQK